MKTSAALLATLCLMVLGCSREEPRQQASAISTPTNERDLKSASITPPTNGNFSVGRDGTEITCTTQPTEGLPNDSSMLPTGPLPVSGTISIPCAAGGPDKAYNVTGNMTPMAAAPPPGPPPTFSCPGNAKLTLNESASWTFTFTTLVQDCNAPWIPPAPTPLHAVVHYKTLDGSGSTVDNVYVIDGTMTPVP